MRKGVPGMNRFFVGQFFIILSLLLFPLTEVYAKAGCCSRHGGVVGCDSATGHQMCKDGTPSPSCGCNGSSTKPMKTTKTTKQKQTTTDTTAAQPATTTTTTTTAQPATTTTTKSTKGCCSRHGGVAQCNKAAGYFMCQDGTQSSTCKCS